MKPSRLILSLALCGFASITSASDGYFRFPAVRGGSVVFTAEGDLWKVAATGGQAQRLTSHPGTETNAAISHDGKWLAFSANYEGMQEAYLMPMAGGVPRRLTFQNSNVTVLGWSAQGELLYSTQRDTGPTSQLVVAALEPQSMRRRVFPLADAHGATLDDSGKTLYFTRFGLALTRDNARNYRGGAAAQLWRFAVDGRQEAVPMLPGETGNSRNPMWWNGKLVFISDRTGTDNLWAMNPEGGGLQQLTHHKDWDVRHAAQGDGKVAYQLGADLRLFDLARQSDQALDISLQSDFDQRRPRPIRTPLEQLTGVNIAHGGQKLAITARGRVVLAGPGPQRRVELPLPANARGRDAVLSPDGKSVYLVMDATGENEIWKFAADGSGHGEQLTKGGGMLRHRPLPSPDGKWLVHSDRRARIWLLDLATKANVLLDDGSKVGVDEIQSVRWSPDSRTVAIARVVSGSQRRQIGLADIAAKRVEFVTTDRYESHSPVFSPDGRWLWFLSDRHFKVGNIAPWGDRNMGPSFDNRTGVYALALQARHRFPFKQDDELGKAAPEAGPGAAPATAAIPPLEMDGLAQRLYEVPLAPGNYIGVETDGSRLYVLERAPGEAADPIRSTLKTLAISNSQPQPEVFAANVRSFGLSGDGKQVYFQTGVEPPAVGELHIAPAGAKAPPDLGKSRVALSDWTVALDPRKEWEQLFNDAWRTHRDFLFHHNMRGVDWAAMRKKYAPLVARVTERGELNDVLGMLGSEVGTLHSQVRPGDLRKVPPEGVPAGLGAVLARTADGYRIEHIYRSEAENPSRRGPLAQPDLDIREGDTITAINHQPTLEARDISDLLRNQAGRQTLLHIKRGAAAARPVMVQPMPAPLQQELRYEDWEQNLARRVLKESNGQIGYLHLRSMVSADIGSFAHSFYSHTGRDGLIIDVRRNRGGSIDSWIIEKLLRKAWTYWSSPTLAPEWNMHQTFRGHLVVLVDQLTYSDGETFAEAVKQLKLGQVVGMRTAGAGVWLADGNPLADNGMLRTAERAQFDVDNKWMIEGVGITPDVVVDNPPHATFNGGDRQLETALELLRNKIKSQPLRKPQPPVLPPLWQ